MRPTTPIIRSKKWRTRSFHLKAPMRTNSTEVLKAGTVVTTTGELTKSRWFVCVKYSLKYRDGVMRLEAWLRRKDLLNPLLATTVTPEIVVEKRKQRIFDKLSGLAPTGRPS